MRVCVCVTGGTWDVFTVNLDAECCISSPPTFLSLRFLSLGAGGQRSFFFFCEWVVRAGTASSCRCGTLHACMSLSEVEVYALECQ